MKAKTSGTSVSLAVEAPAAKSAPDLSALTGRWDELVTRVRTSGKALLAGALEASSPHAITAKGDLTISLDEPNDFHARAIEQAAPDVLAILGEWFAGVERIVVHRDEAPGPQTQPKRVTDEMVRAERLNALRRRDPKLDAAIDVLDLEIAD